MSAKKKYAYLCYRSCAQQVADWAKRNGIKSRTRPTLWQGEWHATVTLWVPDGKPDLPAPSGGAVAEWGCSAPWGNLPRYSTWPGFPPNASQHLIDRLRRHQEGWLP